MESKISFYDRLDFELDKEIGREYFEGDIGQVINFYRVNREDTVVNKFSGEIVKGSINYEPAVELRGVVKIEKSEGVNFDDKGLHTQYFGTSYFYFYEDHLNEKGVEINIGDFIGFYVKPDREVYFEVTDPNIINLSNSESVSVYRDFQRVIKGVQIKEDLFIGNSNSQKTTD